MHWPTRRTWTTCARWKARPGHAARWQSRANSTILLCWRAPWLRCGRVTAWDATQARPYLSEAADLARTISDRWRLSQILYFQALMATVGSGELEDGIAAADEGRALADEIGDRGYSRACRWCLTGAQLVRGDLADAEKQLRELMIEADLAHALIWQVNARAGLCHVLAHTGRAAEGRALGARITRRRRRTRRLYGRRGIRRVGRRRTRRRCRG